MKIIAEDLGKRFNKDWIFKDFNYTFTDNNSFAITGPNGSGKSTLLQVLSSHVLPSQGKIRYDQSNSLITPENIFKIISFVSPLQELVEEFTLEELLKFHTKFRPLENHLSFQQFADLLSLSQSFNKPLSYFSSGMKQRVKLALALFSKSTIILLDEPTVNLDANGIRWYQTIIPEVIKNRIVIVSSNQMYEYEFCNHIIRIQDYH